MSLYSRLVARVVTWGWCRLTPAQRTDFLYARRHELVHSLSRIQQCRLLETVLLPAERQALAADLWARSLPKDRSYVY